MTLQVVGLKTVLTKKYQATTLPLPTTLAGISVTLTQFISSGQVSTPVPLLAINQGNICSVSSTHLPECGLTLITVQTPFELVVPQPSNINPELVISENGVSSRAFEMRTSADNIHVVTDCDLGAWVGFGCAVPSPSSSGSPMVTHADGTLVWAESPAKPGEVVVIYAWGLGPTAPAVKTGAATPTPAPALPGNNGYGGAPLIQFDFRPNASPSSTQGSFNLPVFAGLVPGQVGLYQVNVKLPTSFPSVDPCSGGIRSNLTINLVMSSFDGAAICVQPTQ